MTDIRKLVEKHGGDIDFAHYENDALLKAEFRLNLAQLQSLLAEHLALSSSEPEAHIFYNNELEERCVMFADDVDALLLLNRNDISNLSHEPLFKANPLNTQLLDSHRRLEEALIAAVLGIEFVSEKMNLDLHFVVALKEALLAIPESVKESK
jgi:hypothetical protein